MIYTKLSKEECEKLHAMAMAIPFGEPDPVPNGPPKCVECGTVVGSCEHSQLSWGDKWNTN